MKKILFSLMILASVLASGQTFNEQKSIERHFISNAQTELDISSKYGNIVITISPDDSIRIKADVSVGDKNAIEAKEQIDAIEIIFASTGSKIQATTVFNGNRHDFRTDMKVLAGNVFNTTKSVRIDYAIEVPAGTTLRLNHAYGNVLMPDFSGSLTLALDAGDFTAGALSGKSNLTVNSGKAEIAMIQQGMINSNMSDWIIDSLGNVFFDSRGSQITISHAGQLSIDSKRDKWFLTSIAQMNGSGNFSSFSVQQLYSDCNIKTFYGSLSLMSIHPDFRNVTLMASYCDISLGLPPSATPFFQADMKKTRSVFPVWLQLSTDTIDQKAGMYRVHNPFTEKTQRISMNLTGGSISVF